MKKIILSMAIFAMTTMTAQAQAVYQEILRMSKEVANDEKKDTELRKIAMFKVDELNYMAIKTRELMPDSSAAVLDHQALAMYEFINMYMDKMAIAKKKEKKELVKYYFKQATTNNPRFQDTDTELTLAYYNNDAYLTQFSLDTDWQKALLEVKKRNWSNLR